MTKDDALDLDHFISEAAQEEADAAEMTEEEKLKKVLKERDPTRYGDWEFKGRCIDF